MLDGNYTAWNRAASLIVPSADRQVLVCSRDNVLDLEPTALMKLALMATVVCPEKPIPGRENAVNDHPH